MTPVFSIPGRIKYSMKTTGRYLEGKAIECTFLNQLEGTNVDVYRYLEPLYNDYRK
ncbi:hypothetical protein FCV25MIE_13303, partial [Fagus crenata]